MAENTGANSLFGGLVFHCDTRQKDGTNNSSTYEARAKDKGGKVEKALTAKVTHLVWKDGDPKVRPLAPHAPRCHGPQLTPHPAPLAPPSRSITRA